MEKTVEELKKELAAAKSELASERSQRKDVEAQLAEAHEELEHLHADVEGRAALNVTTQKIEKALSDLEKVRAAILAWFVSGEELTTDERRRLNGSGVRRWGFITKVAEMIDVNPELMPSFLNRTHFGSLKQQLEAVRRMHAIAQQCARMCRDVLLILGDEAYSKSLIYYGAVREASAHNVPGATELFRILHEFFRRGRTRDDDPTIPEIESDVDAILHRKKDGKYIIEHHSGHTTPEKHVVIGEAHTPHHGEFEKTVSGEFDEHGKPHVTNVSKTASDE